MQSDGGRAVERYGGLDILINNVGIGRGGTAVEVSEEEWDLVLNVNLKSMMLTSKHAIPIMIEGGGGTIVEPVLDQRPAGGLDSRCTLQRG